MANTLKQRTASGLLWGALNNGSQQLLNAVVGIVMARNLSKADYGLVGMVLVFSAVAGIFQEGGFISALNKRKNDNRSSHRGIWEDSLR